LDKKSEAAIDSRTGSILLAGKEGGICWQLKLGEHPREEPSREAHPRGEHSGPQEPELILVIVAHCPEKPLLHWGVAYTPPWASAYEKCPSGWVLPPPIIRPPETVDCRDGLAVQTPMIEAGESGLFSITITIPTSLNIRQILFVLYFPQSHTWDNNQQQDYIIPLPARSDIPLLLTLAASQQGEAPLIQSILGRILAHESRKHWEMGMRLEFIGHLLDEFEPTESVLSLLEIYLQYAAQGHLPWRRHYDRQTYILAPKILRLAEKISELLLAWRPRFLPIWRRMLGNLPSSGRNLQDIGLAIRLKILECKDHQIRIIYDPFVSDFHQKLHNASGPEDVAICRAYLAFLDSGGDINQFYQSLWQAGLAKEERLDNGQKVFIPLLDLYGDCRSIRHLPTYDAQKAQATRKVFDELLTLLEKFFGGMEVEEAIVLVKPQADSDLWQKLQNLLALKEKQKAHGSSPPAFFEAICSLAELRLELRSRILHSSLTSDDLRKFLHLDLALGNYAKALAASLLNALSSTDSLDRSHHHLIESLFSCFDLLDLLILHLSADAPPEAEIPLIQQHLRQWLERGKRCGIKQQTQKEESAEDWYLEGKAILARLGHVIQTQARSRIALYQPKAELLGRLLEISPKVWQTFSEESLRHDWLFYLSRLLTLARHTLRQIAGWSATEVLVPGRVQGKVARLDELSSLPSSSLLGEAPLILLLEHLRGDEDIPEGIAAMISRIARDRLSHFGIRAREQGVVWICLEEEADYQKLKQYEGAWIELLADEDQIQVTTIDPPSPLAHPAAGKVKSRGFSLPVVSRAGALTLVYPEQYELSTVGPKAYQLRLLRERLCGQVQVPDSIAVPFGVFELLLQANPKASSEYRKITDSLARGEESVAAADSSQLGKQLEALRKLIESLDISQDYCLRLRQAVQERLGPNVPLILRSSSNAEDLESYSAAGLYESYPGVHLEELPRFLKKVWASQWSLRAVTNRLRAGIPHQDVHLAVLIQELILADYAFVVHTHYPLASAGSQALSESRDQLYIELVQGLGESLVGGSEGQGYQLLYERSSGELKRIGFATKGWRWVIGADGLPVRVVSDYSNDLLCLEKDKWAPLIRQVALISIMIEAAWGNQPQDIEGVIKDGKIFIVQTRPQQIFKATDIIHKP